jgi:hypothetical protein
MSTTHGSLQKFATRTERRCSPVLCSFWQTEEKISNRCVGLHTEESVDASTEVRGIAQRAGSFRMDGITLYGLLLLCGRQLIASPSFANMQPG